jgi:hypothetical protein
MVSRLDLKVHEGSVENQKVVSLPMLGNFHGSFKAKRSQSMGQALEQNVEAINSHGEEPSIIVDVVKESKDKDRVNTEVFGDDIDF